MNDILRDFLVTPESVWGSIDAIDVVPQLSYNAAYCAQFAAKDVQQREHGPVIGYQASLTSEAAKRFGPSDMPKPYVGTLLLRNWREERTPFDIGPEYFIECEVGMRMAARLQGPGVTASSARQAVGSLHAAVEVVPVLPIMLRRSGQHMIAIHNCGSWCVFSKHSMSRDLDLRDEPITCLFDGKVAATGNAGNSGGDPFAVLAEVANILGQFDRALYPGMIVMTGAGAGPAKLLPETREVQIRFARLGTVSVRFETPEM